MEVVQGCRVQDVRLELALAVGVVAVALREHHALPLEQSLAASRVVRSQDLTY